MKFLLTGFEPFGKNQSINPSEDVVRRLAETGVEGVDLATAVLPVHRDKGPERLLRVFTEARPDAVLLLGQAGGYAVPFIERFFVNLLDYTAEWGEGIPVKDEPCNPEGPAAYLATLPVREIHDALLKAGLPCRLSLSAGTYICNQLGYVIHDHIRKNNLGIPAGLIHLPFVPEQAAAGAHPSMTRETMCRVVTMALQTTARTVAQGVG